MKFQFPKCDCDCCCAMTHMTECRTLWGKRMCLILFTGHQSKTCGRGHSDQGSRVPSFWLDAPPSMPVMQVSRHQEDWQFSHASRHILIKKCYGQDTTSEHLIEQNLSWACSDTSGCLCHTSMVSTLFQNAYCITVLLFQNAYCITVLLFQNAYCITVLLFQNAYCITVVLFQNAYDTSDCYC